MILVGLLFILDNTKIVKTIENTRVFVSVGQSGGNFTFLGLFFIKVEYLTLIRSKNEKIHCFVYNLIHIFGSFGGSKKRDLGH
jgi:hypothetical protein